MKKLNWPLPVIFVILSSTSEHKRATHKMSVHKQELTSIMQKTKNMVILNISLAPCQLHHLLTGSQCETVHQTSEHNYIKFLKIMCPFILQTHFFCIPLVNDLANLIMILMMCCRMTFAILSTLQISHMWNDSGELTQSYFLTGLSERMSSPASGVENASYHNHQLTKMRDFELEIQKDNLLYKR